MKIISYSLWGNNPTYLQGAVENAKLASIFYPDWISYFYVSSSVSTHYRNVLNNIPNVVVINRDYIHPDDSRGMFWRFEAVSLKKATHIIIRDTDSRLSKREALAVEDWIDSQSDCHIMRDHPYHNAPILGGMWGVKAGLIEDIKVEILKFRPTKEKAQDQIFLKNFIYEKIIMGKLSQKVHDSFFEKKPFPLEIRGKTNNGVWFIGQCFDENNRPNSINDINILMEAITNEQLADTTKTKSKT